MAKWSFLTNHARALVCIAQDPGVRLREMAVALDITERSAFGIVTELVGAGYVVKDKEGRRNRYRIQEHLPLRDSVARERTIGEILDVLVKASPPANANQPAHEPSAAAPGLLGRGDATAQS
jgi:DNA-binding IclR family transcriptional regulator